MRADAKETANVVSEECCYKGNGQSLEAVVGFFYLFIMGEEKSEHVCI